MPLGERHPPTHRTQHCLVDRALRARWDPTRAAPISPTRASTRAPGGEPERTEGAGPGAGGFGNSARGENYAIVVASPIQSHAVKETGERSRRVCREIALRIGSITGRAGCRFWLVY